MMIDKCEYLKKNVRYNNVIICTLCKCGVVCDSLFT